MIKEVGDLTKAEREAHEKEWGRFNSAPPGWEEITPVELIRATPYRSYTPRLCEFRQIMPPADGVTSLGPMFDVRLWFYHDGTGIGQHIDYYKNEIRWFRFGCKHQMETTWPRMHERHDKCKLCGREFVYDTSG